MHSFARIFPLLFFERGFFDKLLRQDFLPCALSLGTFLCAIFLKLMRQLFRRAIYGTLPPGFFREHYRQGFFRPLFRRYVFPALCRKSYFGALPRKGFVRLLFCRDVFPAFLFFQDHSPCILLLAGLSGGAFPMCSFAGLSWGSRTRRRFLCNLSQKLYPHAFWQGLLPWAFWQRICPVCSFAVNFFVRCFIGTFCVSFLAGLSPLAFLCRLLFTAFSCRGLSMRSFKWVISVFSFAW